MKKTLRFVLSLLTSLYIGLSYSAMPDHTIIIEKLYKNANGDAYQLSMPLLASSYTQDKKLYFQILSSIQPALNQIQNKNSYKAWLLGRVLIAANNMHDQATVHTTQIELESLLNQTSPDEFSTWAWGYLAALNTKEYQKTKQIILNLTDQLHQNYVNEKTHDNLSAAIWAWVMDLQAAANAKDQQTYQYILQQIKLLTHQSTISKALSTGLSRTSASNDYPAWAFALTQVAAVKMGDQALYAELSKPLENSIQAAKLANATAEAVLAESNRQFAIKLVNPG